MINLKEIFKIFLNDMIILSKVLSKAFLLIIAIISIPFAIFCFMGGPDPGSGSGSEGVSYGAIVILIGVVCLILGKIVKLSKDYKKKSDKKDN